MNLLRRSTYARYTQSSKLVIYFAVCSAKLRKSSVIEPSDILIGLAEMKHQDTCGFRFLHERRHEVSRQLGIPFLPEDAKSKCEAVSAKPILADPSKRILAYAVMETEAAQQFWIDTDLLQAGLLREGGVAAETLSAIGYDLEATRRLGKESRLQWPPRKPNLRDRARTWPKIYWIVAGFVFGILAVNLFNLLRAIQ